VAESVLKNVLGDGMNRFLISEQRRQYDLFRKFYLGYTELEESIWLRFNRCCHEGRNIRIVSRPVTIRVGKPSISVRRPANLERIA